MQPFSLLSVVLLVLTSCSSTHTLRRQGAAPKLPANASIYVAVPADGWFEKTAYERSGLMTAEAIETALRRHVARVERGSTVEAPDTALSRARAMSCAYCVIPVILHWEDRATEWSSRPDRIEIQISIVDVSSARTLDSVVITGKSKWATFGGDHPQELLAKPVGEYIDSLF